MTSGFQIQNAFQIQTSKAINEYLDRRATGSENNNHSILLNSSHPKTIIGGLHPRDERSRHLDWSRPHFPLGEPGHAPCSS